MGLPITVLRNRDTPYQEGEPPELKHLSRGRKRNQHGIPLLAASEEGKVQTESFRETCGRCGVKGLASFLTGKTEVAWKGLP